MCTSKCVLARALAQCVVPLPRSDGHAVELTESRQTCTERVNPFMSEDGLREKARGRHLGDGFGS